MGKTGFSRRGLAQSATPGSTRRPRGEGRLDPVRWRRPGRGTLLRLVAVAALLATAAAVLWSPPARPRAACDQATGRGGATAPSAAAEANPSGAVKATPGAGGATPAGTKPPGSGAAPADPGRSLGVPGASITEPGGGAPVPDGSVGVPIRLADPTALGLVRPGNRVDLLRVDDAGGRPTAVAGSALVLRVTGADDPATGGLLLALSPQEASRAVVASRQGFAIVIRPG